MKNKNLILWNDVPIFYKKQSVVEILSSKLFDELKFRLVSECVKYHFIDYRNFYNWMESALKLDALLALGKRFENLAHRNDKVEIIHPKRVFDPDSLAQSNCLDELCMLKMKNIRGEKDVHLLEDVIVTGRTMILVLSKLLEMKKNINIVVHAFIANSGSLVGLKKKFPNVDFRIHIEFTGEPLVNSTVFRFYDLIFKKLNGKLFIDHEELLKRFLDDNYKDIKENVTNLRLQLEKFELYSINNC